MCKIRGFRHACDHTDYRFISICRGTISTQNSPKIPLCLGRESSDIVISLVDRCISCNFETFRQNWESRISEAEKKRDFLQARLFTTNGQVPTISTYPGWGTYDFDSSDSWYDFDSSSSTSIEPSGSESDTTLPPNEEARLKMELAAAQTEVDKLRRKFSHDMWHNWQGYYGNSTWISPSRRPSHWKRRVTNPKVQCGSPLSQVSNLCDQPDPVYDVVEFQSPIQPFGSEEESTDGDSDYSISPSSSTFRAFSSHTYIDSFAASDYYRTQKSTESPEPITTTKSQKSLKNPSQDSPTLLEQAEDSDDVDMLPNWFDFI